MCHGNDTLRFGSLDEVINDNNINNFEQGMKWLDQSNRVLNMGLSKCIDCGKA